MSSPMFETLGGIIDGINAVFSFPLAYTPGTVAIFFNGQLLTGGDGSGDPWVESNSASGEITLAIENIPNAGAWGTDTITGFAMDTTPDIGSGTPFDGIDCMVSEDSEIICTIDDELECISVVVGCP